MDTPRWDNLIVVARVARSHGRRGEVILNPETDFLEERFQPGRRFFVLNGPRVGTLVVRSVWFHRDRPVVEFDGYESIDQAETLAGIELRIEASDLQPLPPDVYYHHDLIGCVVETADGTAVGTVRSVDGAGTASRLVVDGPSGERLIPLAADICRTIDPAHGRIVIDVLDGLLDLNVERSRRVRRSGRR